MRVLLDQDAEADEFFESLSKSYKHGYCDWIGSAKQKDTRKVSDIPLPSYNRRWLKIF